MTQPEENVPQEETQKTSMPVTFGLLLLCLLVFLVTSYPTFKQPQHWAIVWGVFYPPAIDEGQYWRVITGNLMHANWMHLLNNGFAIFIFGRLLEPVIGSRAMFWLLVSSAISCHLFSYLFLPEPTLGASGMAMGLVGAYLTLVLLVRRKQDIATFWQEVRGTIGYLVIFALWSWAGQHILNFWGHLGGLLSGVVFAWIWYSLRTTKQS